MAGTAGGVDVGPGGRVGAGKDIIAMPSDLM